MSQINLFKTTGSLVQKPKNGFVAMFADESDTIKFKKSDNTVVDTLLTATSASYANQAEISTRADYGYQDTIVYRATTTTSANGAVTWTELYRNAPASVLTLQNSDTEIKVGQGVAFRMEWYIGYVPSSNYFTMDAQYLVGSTWTAWRGNVAYGRVVTGGGTNWGGGTYAVDVATSNQTFRFLAGSNGLPVGVGLIFTRIS